MEMLGNDVLKKHCARARINWCLSVRMWYVRLLRGNYNDQLINYLLIIITIIINNDHMVKYLALSILVGWLECRFWIQR